MSAETGIRIESEIEVKAYIQNLRYALNNGAKINFQVLLCLSTLPKKHLLQICFRIKRMRGFCHES